jgi:hypothetical protein
MEALASGMAESGIAVRWETVRRPEALRYPVLGEGHLQKLAAGLDSAERELLAGPGVDVGRIAMATTLSWLEFREIVSFRSTHRDLARWLDEFSLRNSMQSTPLSGDTVDIAAALPA